MMTSERLDLARPESRSPVHSSSTSAGIIRLNVGGRIFVTLESTLTGQSPYFKALLSNRWADSACIVDGVLFIDSNPSFFEHILNFLRRSVPPIFWTRGNGFDYPLYTALLHEARYFGITALEKWIVEEQYMASIRHDQKIETVDLSHCLNRSTLAGSYPFSDDSQKAFDATDYLSPKSGVKRKRLHVQITKYQAPDVL